MRTILLAPLLLLACRSTSASAPAPTRSTAPITDHASATATLPAVALDHPGCFTVVALGDDGAEPTRHEGSPGECSSPTIPASTFKVPHALVALQTGVVTDPEALERWDGKQYWLEAWERDHSLRTAIEDSVVWFFQRTAQRIGRDRMRTQLAAIDYGNAAVDGEITTFWLAGGSLLVAPDEQLDFLERMFEGALPIDAKHVATVQDILESDLARWKARVPPDFALPASTATLWAKTGTDRIDDVRLTWWVGAIEGPRGRFVFVSRVRDRGELSGISPAVQHGVQALDRLGLL